MTDPWKDLLLENEQIIWQGAPIRRLRLEWDTLLAPAFFAFFVAFSTYWMILASAGGGYFWTFGLLFFFFGLYGLVGMHIWKAFVRSRQHYTLTDRRAIIGTNIFGRKKLRTYPIWITTEIELEENGSVGNVFFAKHERTGQNGTIVTKIGFEQIENPRKVFSKMQNIRQERARG